MTSDRQIPDGVIEKMLNQKIKTEGKEISEEKKDKISLRRILGIAWVTSAFSGMVLIYSLIPSIHKIDYNSGKRIHSSLIEQKYVIENEYGNPICLQHDGSYFPCGRKNKLEEGVKE